MTNGQFYTYQTHAYLHSKHNVVSLPAQKNIHKKKHFFLELQKNWTYLYMYKYDFSSSSGVTDTNMRFHCIFQTDKHHNEYSRVKSTYN